MRLVGEYYVENKNFSKGAFSKLYIGYQKYTKKRIAIKEIHINIKNKKYVQREIELHKKLNHPNIVKLYDVILDKGKSKINIVLEYCLKGDLAKFQNKRPLNEIYVQNFIYQLASGLKYLRDMNILHRDLKPQNLLVNENLNLKISDFGLAKQYQTNTIDKTLKQTFCGSPIYMAPEILNNNDYDSKSDIWSIGVIIYELITGRSPYKVTSLKQLINNAKIPIVLPLEHNKRMSSECKDLLYKLLSIKKNSRITWDNFFNHQWLQKNELITYQNNLICNPLNYELTTMYEIFYIKTNSKVDKLNDEISNKSDNKGDLNGTIDIEPSLTNKEILPLVNKEIPAYNINYLNNNNSNELDYDFININGDINSVNSDLQSNPSDINSINSDINSVNSDLHSINSINSITNNDENSTESYSLQEMINNTSNISIDNSYFAGQDYKFTLSLESSNNEISHNSRKIKKSEPIDIKTNPIDIKTKSYNYDFHNEVDLYGLHNGSLDQIKHNKSDNFKKFINSSFQILKESYQYISNNNKSI